MIVPMKKVSLLVQGSQRKRVLKQLRRLGLLHIAISEGSSERLTALSEQISALESGVYAVAERVDKTTVQKPASTEEALDVARRITALAEETQSCYARLSDYTMQLERLKGWGDIAPAELDMLAKSGVPLVLYEMPPAVYEQVQDAITALVLGKNKTVVRFLLVDSTADEQALKPYCVQLPALSTEQIRQKIAALEQRIQAIDSEKTACAAYVDSMKAGMAALQKELQFETYATGMEAENLAAVAGQEVSVAYFTGYIPAEDIDKLKELAKDNAWGLLVEDPTVDDDVPTKLQNNKFVSLIYPLTDFLGTVPGYFEYDISSWFLAFILIFFGIIFGDGGYGLFICGAAGALIAPCVVKKKPVPPTYLLILLFGAATVLWGTLTCTWFGLSPDSLPGWLKSLSIPIFSNVYADKIWYPFWTNGGAGLTTTQNVQIFCFALALVQLSAAHIKGAIRNRKSLKILGDIGSVFQLIGMFYVVLSLVVNAEVFSLGLVIAGVPVGTTAMVLVLVGFLLTFIFANYEGSVGKAVLESLKNIVSVLLGVVNVFSDIVSYIRLWAVGLAGAAISATVNELVGPLLGNFLFMILAIVLLVFGHGLNMILNVLSVIVHGVRLNTLEFSSHLDMSWSGHKFQPFEE